MTLQFPIPQFVGQTVRYQGGVWVWDSVGWHLDDVAGRLDLALIPAYMGQLVYRLVDGQVDVDLGSWDIYGATFALTQVPPFEGIKVYLNGNLLVADDGTGTLGDYAVNRMGNRIDFLRPVVADDIVHVGILMPPETLAPGRVDVREIKDLDTDWVTDPDNPTTGMVDGVRRVFDLLWDQPGGDQEFAVIGNPIELALFENGNRLKPNVDYLVIGAELTMTVAPQPGVPFWALWYLPVGAGGSGAVEPPQPPGDGITAFYGWRPGEGSSWQDSRGVAITVPNAAGRNQLRPDIDLIAGRLVLQADTGELWRWTGAAWVRYLDAGTFTAPQGGRSQNLRSSTALERPAGGSVLPGEFWMNAADGVFGYGDDVGDPVVLLPRVIASAGAPDAGKIPELGAQGILDQSFFTAGLQPYGTQDVGSIALVNWNDAHLNGTTAVRAPAGTANRPPGADIPFAGQYIAMGDADTGVLMIFSPVGNTVYARPRNAGIWGNWVQVNSPGLDLASAMLRANNLNDVNSKPASRTNLEALFNPRTVYAGDLNVLDETGLYALGIGVTNGWTNDGTGGGGEATVGDAVLHTETGGGLAFQMGFNLRPAAPAALPLRVRFMTGPTTWTPWASIQTSDEVMTAITAFGYARQMDNKDANAAGLVTEFFRATAGAPVDGDWHTLMMSRALNAQGAQIAVRDGAGNARARAAIRHRAGTGAWVPWLDVQTIIAGTTAERPTNNLFDGVQYFDTTLQRLLVYNLTRTRWDIVGGAAATFVGDNAPPEPEVGQLWYRTVSPVGLYLWHIDADSSQWIQVGGGSQAAAARAAEAAQMQATIDNMNRVIVGLTQRIAALERAH